MIRFYIIYIHNINYSRLPIIRLRYIRVLDYPCMIFTLAQYFPRYLQKNKIGRKITRITAFKC